MQHAHAEAGRALIVHATVDSAYKSINPSTFRKMLQKKTTPSRSPQSCNPERPLTEKPDTHSGPQQRMAPPLAADDGGDGGRQKNSRKLKRLRDASCMRKRETKQVRKWTPECEPLEGGTWEHFPPNVFFSPNSSERHIRKHVSVVPSFIEL